MENPIDLLTFTYSQLIPQIQGLFPQKCKQLKEIIEETSLPSLSALEGSLEGLSSQSENSLPKLRLLFSSKYFLISTETEKLRLEEGDRAISCLQHLKQSIENLDSSACVEDFISNLDLTVSEATLEELFSWAKLIKSIPSHLGSHENFIPILSIRLKSLIWNKMPCENLPSHIDIATTLKKCTVYKDLELNDLIDIVVDHCLDFIEDTNDFSGIEQLQGKVVEYDKQGTSELIGVLKSIQIPNKDLAIRLAELEKRYGANDVRVENSEEEIRMNEIKSLREITLTDKIFYNHMDHQNRIQTTVRGGLLLNGTPVAVKIYESQNPDQLVKCIDEIDTLKTLSNQKNCFLKYYGSIKEENKVYIVTEMCEKTLYDDLISRKAANKHYTQDEKITIMTDLLEGFAFMSYRKKYHQDIKPQNIMFTSDNIVKIIDFNVTIQTEEIEISVGVGQEYAIQGTKSFMSPEVLEVYLRNIETNQNLKLKRKLSKADVFSLGLVFLSLYIYDRHNGLNQADKNEALIKLVETSVDNHVIKETIKSMLNLNPNLRPSFRKLLAGLPSKTTKAN